MEITNLLTPNHQRAHHHNQPHNTPPHHRQSDHLYGTTSPSRYASSVKSLPSLGSSSGYDQHRSVLPSGPNAFSSSSSSPMSHSPNSVQLPPLRDTFKDYLGNDPQQPSSSSYGLQQQQQQQQQSHSQYQHSNTQQSPSHHRYLSGYRTHANSSTSSLPSYHHSSTPSTPLPVLHSSSPPGLTAGPTHQSSRHMPPQLSSSSSPASSAPSSSYHIPQQHQQQQAISYPPYGPSSSSSPMGAGHPHPHPHPHHAAMGSAGNSPYMPQRLPSLSAATAAGGLLGVGGADDHLLYGDGSGQFANRKRRQNLPKATTDILLNWLKRNLDRPYPNSQEKNELVRKTGLTFQQLDNWFINARRRKVQNLKELRNRNVDF